MQSIFYETELIFEREHCVGTNTDLFQCLRTWHAIWTRPNILPVDRPTLCNKMRLDPVSVPMSSGRLWRNYDALCFYKTDVPFSKLVTLHYYYQVNHRWYINIFISWPLKLFTLIWKHIFQITTFNVWGKCKCKYSDSNYFIKVESIPLVVV
jgi:hypothetical protein